MISFSLILLGLSLGFLVSAMQTDLNRETITRLIVVGAGVILFYVLTTSVVFHSSASLYTVISFISAIVGAYTLLVFKYIVRNGKERIL